jgi:hypothetical protein
MDSLLEHYQMVADLSEIQPFERLRDMLGFYTSEAARAAIDRNKYRGERRRVERRLRRLTASLRGSVGARTKWQADVEIENQPTIVKLRKELDHVNTMIEFLDDLSSGFSADAAALSREQTAREIEYRAYHGRPGSGR